MQGEDESIDWNISSAMLAVTESWKRQLPDSPCSPRGNIPLLTL